MMVEKTEEYKREGKMVKKEDTMQVRKKNKIRSSSFYPPPAHSLLRSHSLSPTPLVFTPPLFPSFPYFTCLSSGPHSISGSPLNKRWRDNSAIVALVWEPWTETNAVYPSVGTAWTLSFITTGPSLIKSVRRVLQ